MQHRARITLILIAFAAYVCIGLPEGVLGVAWPSIRHELGVPISQLGSLLFASMCGYLTCSSLSGPLSVRFGLGGVLLVGALAMAIAQGGYALAPAWWVMVTLATLSGSGCGTLDGALNQFAASHFSPRSINWMHACFGLGASISPLAMTAILTRGGSWRWGYAMVSSSLILVAIAIAATIRQWQETRASDAPQPASERDEPGVLGQVAVWINVAIFFLYCAAEAATGQLAFSLLTESRGIGVTFAGWCVGVYWGSLTFGRFLFGAAAARWSAPALLRVATVVTPIGALWFWLARTPVGAMGSLALFGLALAPVFPLLIGETPVRMGKNLARHAIGLQMAAACLGGAAGPGLAGVAARRLGLESVLGPMVVAAALLMLALHEWSLRHELESPVNEIDRAVSALAQVGVDETG
jgi:fucose permease